MNRATAASGAGVGGWSRGICLTLLEPIRRSVCGQFFSAGLTVIISPRPNQSFGYIVQRCGVMLDLGRTKSRAGQIIGCAINAAPACNNFANHPLNRIFAVVGQQRGDVFLCPRCSASASYSDCGVTKATGLPKDRGAVTVSPQIRLLMAS